jgi:hypothetical protein
MKKVFLVLALVAVYGVSMAMSNASFVVVDNVLTTIVSDLNDNNVVAPEGEKDKATKKEEKAAKSEGCAGEKSAAKSEGCAGEKSAAKSEGCAGEKSAKSDGCGEKTKTASVEKK